MYDLIRQTQDPTQTRGRADRVTVIRFRPSNSFGIRYLAPNRKEFIIDLREGSPVIFSRWPIECRLPGGHSTHYFGEGRVCIGNNVGDLQLYELLYMIDAWACGLEIYLKTGQFPQDPKESFRRQNELRRSHGGSLWNNLRRAMQ